jgi:inner membrane protein
MSPIVHAELAWLAAARVAARRDRLLVVLAGVAPDLDGLALLGGEEAYGRYHHVLFHNFGGALLTTVLCALCARSKAWTALLALLAFHLHIVCDLAGSGPGWPVWYFWPLARTPWSWAGQWDLASWQNGLVALAATLGCLACAMPLGRTPVELFSQRIDARVVATLRARFARTLAPPG